MARFYFKNNAKTVSSKVDFTASLAFISKVDNMEVKGVEPLRKVFEFYVGYD
jgi:hypothetical protein